MDYKLINSEITFDSAIEQVLYNRGIHPDDFSDYLDDEKHWTAINPPEALGEEEMDLGAEMVGRAILNNDDVVVIIDCDCDGWTSSAIMINYLYEVNPEWAEAHLSWFMHDGKLHGLSDFDCEGTTAKLVIVPDAGSDDLEQHNILHSRGIDVLVLDHHHVSQESVDASPAVIINSQLNDYPNPSLCGVGVTWQFCRYLIGLANDGDMVEADKYLDLVALGQVADMMDLRQMETRALVDYGFELGTKNPFFSAMALKNSYSMKDELTPMTTGFYVAPFINAMTRSGTLEEKYEVFDAFLKHKAYVEVPSTKRGAKPGDMEWVYNKAVRVATNVKNRQKKAQDVGMEYLENYIEQHLSPNSEIFIIKDLDRKVDPNITGLVANVISKKYGKPTLILSKKNPEVDLWSGSGRGFEGSMIPDFREYVGANGAEYASGHANAFGAGFTEANLQGFQSKIEEAAATGLEIPMAVVELDFIFGETRRNDCGFGEACKDLYRWRHLWGQGIKEPRIGLEGVRFTSKDVSFKGAKQNTIGIRLPDGSELIQFGASPEMVADFTIGDNQYREYNIIGYAALNEYMGNITPQLKIDRYEIVDECYDF